VPEGRSAGGGRCAPTNSKSRSFRSPDAKPGAGIHHPRFGFFLKERMDKLGIECQVRLREEYGGDRTPQMFRDMVAFFQKYFPK
jgi:hypothetical protein